MQARSAHAVKPSLNDCRQLPGLIPCVRIQALARKPDMSSELLTKPALCQRWHFTPLEKAVLLTVHYRDLFRHPLTVEELRKYLVLAPVDAAVLDEALGNLMQTHLSRSGDYIVWKGRENIVEER